MCCVRRGDKTGGHRCEAVGQCVGVVTCIKEFERLVCYETFKKTIRTTTKNSIHAVTSDENWERKAV